jgi:hypothetical protein
MNHQRLTCIIKRMMHVTISRPRREAVPWLHGPHMHMHRCPHLHVTHVDYPAESRSAPACQQAIRHACMRKGQVHTCTLPLLSVTMQSRGSHAIFHVVYGIFDGWPGCSLSLSRTCHLTTHVTCNTRNACRGPYLGQGGFFKVCTPVVCWTLRLGGFRG